MGMITRMLRLWKADMHGVMDQFEDKGLLLKQYLREMETSSQQKQCRCNQLSMSHQKMRQDLEHRLEEIGKLEKDLDLAVSKSRDDIARMLIRKRRSIQATCSQLKIQIDALVEEHQYVEKVLEEQRLQYDEIKLKTDAYFRHHQAQQYKGIVTDFQPVGDFQSPTEAEIELELMQRKEALAGEGSK